jgi:hypothetical protein
MWIKNSSQARKPVIACTNPVPDACNELMGRRGTKIWGSHCLSMEKEGNAAGGQGSSGLFLLFCVVCYGLWIPELNIEM